MYESVYGRTGCAYDVCHAVSLRLKEGLAAAALGLLRRLALLGNASLLGVGLLRLADSHLGSLKTLELLARAALDHLPRLLNVFNPRISHFVLSARNKTTVAATPLGLPTVAATPLGRSPLLPWDGRRYSLGMNPGCPKGDEQRFH